MPNGSRNTYRVSVEPNHAGKHEVRLEARFAESNWTLRTFFQVSRPERLWARLDSVLRHLQRNEEDLWMWGGDAAVIGSLFEELLREAGLELDRRRDFPRGAAVISVSPGKSPRPLQLAELKRKLAGRLAPAARHATARPVETLRSA